MSVANQNFFIFISEISRLQTKNMLIHLRNSFLELITLCYTLKNMRY